MSTERADVSDAAADMLRQLTEQHGPLMFHQSGGFWMSASQFEYWSHTT